MSPRGLKGALLLLLGAAACRGPGREAAAHAPRAAEAPPARADVRIGLALARLAASDLPVASDAVRARDWLGPSAPIGLDGTRLLRLDGEALDLSPELSTALRRFQQYAEAGEAARQAPVSADELRAAFLSESGVATVRAAFEESLRASVPLPDGRRLVPELGGEALLADSLRLVRFEDPTHPFVARIAAAGDDPPAVGALLAADPLAALLVDPHGQLRSEVDLWTQRIGRGVPEDRRRAGWARALHSVLQGASDSILLGPDQQLRAIVEHDWNGRLLGLWHLHPPLPTPEGLLPGDVPSPDDLDIARSTGQFLTIVFRPDGFDVHDLSRLPEGSRDPGSAPRADPPGILLEHRSADWRAHFEDLRRQLP